MVDDATKEGQSGSATGAEPKQGVKAARQSQYRLSQRGKMQQGVKTKAEKFRGATSPGQRSRATPATGDGPKCGNCGWSSNHERCPASGATCHDCGKSGHFASVCRSRPKNFIARACKAQVVKAEIELPEADTRNAKAMCSFADAPYIPPWSTTHPWRYG